jgi:tRNA-specific 2-thiouridylase
MDAMALEHHLSSPQGLGSHPPGAFAVDVHGGVCADRMRFSVALDGERVSAAGFDAQGCATTVAAGSAAVSLVRGQALLDAARIGAREIAAELGGLSAGKLHAADLAADALARALGRAAWEQTMLPPPAAPTVRTLVALSGGVDSAVAALLCAREGSQVVAVTLELWADGEHDAARSCCSATAVARARALAHSLGLPHLTLDLRERFRAGVVEPFIASYAAGETPNPCVRCNAAVRLDAMLALARRLGAAQLATGHYARVAERDHPGGPLLRVAADPAKDQSYMLAALSPRSLASMRFPLGELTKPRVRAIAAEAGLDVARRPDSQDLCFLAGTDRGRFLERHGAIASRRGEIVDLAGRVIGTHRGQEHFTVGQRRGLGVAAAQPLYVLDRDAARNRVVVGPRERLLTDRVALRAVQLRRAGARVDRVKLRYRAEALPCRVLGSVAAGCHRALQLQLDEPVAGAAPGQLACLMAGELVVGYGTIDSRPRALAPCRDHEAAPRRADAAAGD